MKNFLLILFILGLSCTSYSQADSISQTPESTRVEQPRLPPRRDTVPVQKKIIPVSRPKMPDSVLRAVMARRIKALRDSLAADSLYKASTPVVQPGLWDTAGYKRYETHPYLSLNKPATYMIIDYHRHESKDDLFYLMAGIVLWLAFIKAGFPKYFRHLFLLFFQTSVRQKQTREQLVQDNLASLLTNLLFFASTALYITLLIKYQHLTSTPFWLLAVICAAVLVLIYLGKYLFLLFAGWVFNTKEATGTYIFLVFMVNKVMGVALVPFLLLLSFSNVEVGAVAITISLGMIGLMFMYRYLVSFGALRNKLKVNALHFFLYLCAVEVLPLLLIYKALINYIDGNF